VHCSAASADTAAARRVGRADILALVVFGALLLLPLAAAYGAQAYTLSLMTRVLAFALAAMSLDLILGYGALVSFGHAAFIGIGAYAAGILASHGIEEATFQIPVAMLAAGLFALVTGAISLRTKGVYFIMITLAFGQMLFFLATSLAAYGGDDGLTLPSRSTLFGTSALQNDVVFYYAVLACLLVVFLLFRSLVSSRFGRVLRATRENAVRAEAIGFHPFHYQLTAYVISGMATSLSGFLLANQTEFVSPAYMTWQRSGELIFMVVLGGMSSLIGPILGAGVFLLMEEHLAVLTEHWKMIFGPFLILAVIFARGGILSLFGRRAP
jgi:branched-chain amino acid transport system permease protein